MSNATGCERSRRNFLKTSLMGGAAVLAATKTPAAVAAMQAPIAPIGFGSKVSLAGGSDRAKIAFDSLLPLKKEIAAAIGNKRVVLKPNNVIIDKPLCASHAENLEGVIEFLHSIGKTNVVIAESPANGSAMDGFANYGYDKLAAKYKVKLVNLDSEGYEVLYVIDQKDLQPHAVRVATMLMDPANNFVISAAKLKTHDLVGITLSLKNIVVGAGIKDSGAGLNRPGSGGGRSDKPIMHGGGTYGINYNLFTLSAKLHPDLAVIDGYEGMEGTGPVNGTPVNQKVCVASMDWLAADRVGAELMGVDFSKIGYLSYCAKAGNRGQADLSKIQVIGAAIKDYQKTYQLPRQWEQITSWQRPIGA
ncbi:MAG TPA: DUF362 domain-containing protein [Acidobacteriaceae bacterium]